MRKKFASALVASLVLTQLTGCSMFNKVTAEDLVKDGFDKLVTAESYELGVELVMDIKAEIEAGMEMGVAIEADLDIEGEDGVTHTEGDIKLEFMGMSMTEEMEEWTEVDDDVQYTYEYSADDDAWYVSETEYDDEEASDEFGETMLDILDDLVLEERESKKDDYVVTATVDMDELKDLLEEFDSESTLDELKDLGIDTDSDEFDLGFKMKMTFDADTKDIKTFKVDIDGDMIDVDGVKFEELYFDVEVKSINEDLGLKVPKSVKNEAMEAPSADDYDIDWGFGDDDDYEFDWGLDEDYTYDDDEIMDIIDDLETDVIVDPVEDEDELEIKIPGEIYGFTTDWTDLQMLIDGVMYDVPFDYAKLVDAGYSFDLADYGYEGGYEMKPGDKVTGTITLENPKFGNSYNSFEPWVGFINNSNETKDITECDIWSIELDIVHGSKLRESYPDLVLINGITWGSSADEILATFGEPQDEYYSDSLGYTKYTFYARDKEARIDYYARLTVYDNYGLTAVEYEFF